MKIRTDFVTNSSSSSFILCFDKKKDYRRFLEYCDWLDYNQLKEFVENYFEKTQKEKRKEKALELLKNYFDSQKYRRNLVLEKFGKSDGSMGYFFKAADYRFSDEYAEKLNELLEKDSDYQSKLKRINNASEILCTEIWDTDGGIFEWAIRHGFLESEFSNLLVLQQNIG